MYSLFSFLSSRQVKGSGRSQERVGKGRGIEGEWGGRGNGEVRGRLS